MVEESPYCGSRSAVVTSLGRENPCRKNDWGFYKNLDRSFRGQSTVVLYIKNLLDLLEKICVLSDANCANLPVFYASLSTLLSF